MTTTIINRTLWGALTALPLTAERVRVRRLRGMWTVTYRVCALLADQVE